MVMVMARFLLAPIICVSRGEPQMSMCDTDQERGYPQQTKGHQIPYEFIDAKKIMQLPMQMHPGAIPVLEIMIQQLSKALNQFDLPTII